MRRPPPYSDLPRYPVTGGTILLAIGVTLLWMSKAYDLSPILTSATIQRGQVWRLLTATLPHVGLFHLAFNCYWTWAFGTLLEAAWGPLATAGTFVLLGMGSMAAEFALLDGGAGLSGVGYGLFGLLWVIGRRDDRFTGAIDGRTANLFLAWFVICIVTTYTGLAPVANIAHGVGLALGAGLAIAVGRGTGRTARVAATCGVAAVVIAGLAGATVLRPFVNRSPAAAADNAYQGWLALDGHRDAQAVHWLADAARMGPHIAPTWYNLGIAYQRVGRLADALAAFNRASEIDPANPDYRNAVANLDPRVN
jgi:membrane associated rhomboid family serine protease